MCATEITKMLAISKRNYLEGNVKEEETASSKQIPGKEPKLVERNYKMKVLCKNFKKHKTTTPKITEKLGNHVDNPVLTFIRRF